MIVQATTVMCECTLMVLIFIRFLVSTIYTYCFYYADKSSRIILHDFKGVEFRDGILIFCYKTLVIFSLRASSILESCLIDC